jgi:hypothetical protein
MDRREDQAAENADQRTDYEAPEIVILGSVEDLTHGIGLPGDDTLGVSTA